MYKKIAVTFVILTLLLLLGVSYLSFSRATITVVAAEQPISTNFVADVVNSPQDINEISGAVVSNIFEQASEITVEGEISRVEESTATGTVTIINTYTNDQTLVATTRLLNKDGILFHIDKTVNVPAGGTVDVGVYADKDGKTGDISPSKFTIPGLSPSLQEKIYAQSSEPFSGGLKKIKTVTQDDLDLAADSLKKDMLSAAKESLALEVNNGYDASSFFTEVIEQAADTPPGTETDKITVSLKMRVIGVFFNEKDLRRIAEGKLFEAVPSGMELLESDDDSLSYQVEEYDIENQMANIMVEFSGKAGLSPTSDKLAKDQFLGKTAGDVVNALESNPAIESAEVNFSPFWLKLTPTLKDHIKVIIE